MDISNFYAIDRIRTLEGAIKFTQLSKVLLKTYRCWARRRCTDLSVLGKAAVHRSLNQEVYFIFFFLFYFFCCFFFAVTHVATGTARSMATRASVHPPPYVFFLYSQFVVRTDCSAPPPPPPPPPNPSVYAITQTECPQGSRTTS